MKKAFLGIDISKQTFHAALISENSSGVRYKEFKNRQSGFEELLKWISAKGDAPTENVHACMEATGIYGSKLATFLFSLGRTISVVNGAQIKAFGQSELLRNKTDKADAHLIARFCQAMTPKAWCPEAKNVQELRALVKRQENEQALLLQEKNRQEGMSDLIKPMSEETIAFHQHQIKKIKEKIKSLIDSDPEFSKKRDLLESIPGVGDCTSARILCFMAEPAKFKKAKQVSAFLGLNPKAYQSGTSVNRRGHISKTGSSEMRKWFYMPALSCMRHNPDIKIFSSRLKSRGKTGKVVVVAAMKKLVHISYGVLKSGCPYQPGWRAPEYRTPATACSDTKHLYFVMPAKASST